MSKKVLKQVNMKKDNDDKRFDDFNDKYGIYVVILILVLLIYGLKFKDDKPKHELTNEQLLSIISQPESSAYKYGYKLGYEMATSSGENYCHTYSGEDVFSGCEDGYQSAIDDR